MTSTPADSQRLPAADAVDHEAAGGADALASQQGLPAVRLGPAAWHEVGGLWYLMLPLVVLLMGWALQGLQAREVDSLRDARLRITLLDIRDTLEADLALGLELNDNTRAQGLLEQALSKDAGLRAAEVFDTDGRSLFNTDRASIHEMVPSTWLSAAFPNKAGTAGPGRPDTQADEGALDTWRVPAGRDQVLGLPLRGPFGEVVGALTLTAAPAPQPSARRFWIWTLGIMVLTAGAGVWWVRRQVRALRQEDAETDAQLAAAAQRLAHTRQRLTLGMGQLAQLDTHD